MRVTKANARKYLQKAIDLFVKITGEAIGTTFTWNGQLNIIGGLAFEDFVKKNHHDVWQTLISSVHKAGQSNQPKAEDDRDMLDLYSKGNWSSLNVFTLRCMVGWITHRAIGRWNFWSDKKLKPEWWPRDQPFKNFRTSGRKSLLAVIDAYKLNETKGLNQDEFRDRSPISSPAPERKAAISSPAPERKAAISSPAPERKVDEFFDDIVSSESEENIPLLEQVDLEFEFSDCPSSDQSFADIRLPPSSPKNFFPQIADAPVKGSHVQDITTRQTETLQQPEHSSAVLIASEDPFSRRVLSEGEMKVVLHELSHPNTFLTDVTMNAFSVLMLKQFPYMKGFQDTILSQERRFTPALPGSVQIHHDGALHWIVSRSDVNRMVYVYDSMYYGSLTDYVKVQLASLYRQDAPHNLDVNLQQIHQQQGGSDCGLFAAAVCVVLGFGGDPTKVKWRQNRMRQHLKQCFEARKITEFPSTPIKIVRKKKLDTIVSIKVECICRLPEFAFTHTANVANVVPCTISPV